MTNQPPKLDAEGRIYFWVEFENAVIPYYLELHEGEVVVRDLYQAYTDEPRNFWPYPKDVVVYGDLDTYRYAVQDHDLGWTLGDVLRLFPTPSDPVSAEMWTRYLEVGVV